MVYIVLSHPLMLLDVVYFYVLFDYSYAGHFMSLNINKHLRTPMHLFVCIWKYFHSPQKEKKKRNPSKFNHNSRLKVLQLSIYRVLKEEQFLVYFTDASQNAPRMGHCIKHVKQQFSIRDVAIMTDAFGDPNPKLQ